MKRTITNALRRATHPAFIAGVLLSGVGVAFNVSHGWQLGGSDDLRAAGMAGVFLAAIVLKDALLGKLATSIKARKFGLAAFCLVGFMLGATGSMIAAFGSASEGREEKSDPRQAQIIAFNTATATVADAEKRLAEIGRTLNVEQAKANVDRLLGNIDAGIAKRTSDCTNVAPAGSGKRVVEVNRKSCEPVQTAKAEIGKAEEADKLRAKLDIARETVAKGAPKAADPLVSNMTALWSKFSGSKEAIDIGAVLSLVIALIVELGAPISWAIWQMSGPTDAETFADTIADRDFDVFRAQLAAPLPDRAGPTIAERLSATEPENEPPKPRKRQPAPTFSGNVVTLAGHPVVEALKANGGSVSSNRQLARLMNVCDGEATKRREEVRDLIEVEKVGKETRIKLKA